MLLNAVLDYAALRGLREVWGEVDRENGRMLELAHELGFRQSGVAHDLGRVRVVTSLDARNAGQVRPESEGDLAKASANHVLGAFIRPKA